MDVLLLDEGFAELAAEIGINGVGEAVTENAEDDVDFFLNDFAVALGESGEDLDDEGRRFCSSTGRLLPTRRRQRRSKKRPTPRAVEVTLLRQGRRGGGGADHLVAQKPLARTWGCPRRNPAAGGGGGEHSHLADNIQ